MKTRAHQFEEWSGSRCRLAWDRMFSASTSSRFKENCTGAPGPGAYNTSNNWEDASGPGVLASKSDRFANRGALLNPPPLASHHSLSPSAPIATQSPSRPALVTTAARRQSVRWLPLARSVREGDGFRRGRLRRRPMTRSSTARSAT